MKYKAVALVLALIAVGAWELWLSHRQGRAPAATASKPVAAASNAQPVPQPAPAAHVAAGPSPRLQPIFGWAGESFAVRFNALHALKGQLNRDEVESLYAFLWTTGARPGGLIGGEHALKNDVMNALGEQKPPPSDLLSNLCALCRGKEQDEVTRDYAVQHVVLLCLKGTNQFVADRPVARETLWSVVAETDSSVAGTAILGLHRLSGMDAEVDAKRVSDAALELAREPGTGELTRITALAVCGERQLKDVLPEAASMAKESACLPLRLSAIAALGCAGGESEKTLLEALQAGVDSPLQPAIKSALLRLKQRLHDTKKPNI